jgi:hypothetical protein
MFQKLPPFAAHVLHEVLGDKTKIFLYLFDQTVTVFEVQMTERQNLL